jgi:membrane associated rhomboid family serine protease
MFPIRDSIPTTQTPVVVYGIIAVNTLVFLYQITLSPAAAVDFAYAYGLVPYVYFDGYSGLRPDLTLTDYIPFVSATFMHGGWLHIIFNMWTLLIFGSTLEGRLGSLQFLIFYLCCAVISTYAHGYFNADSQVPVIGASGAIAGVIGAYAVRFPTARITLLVPIIIIPLIFTVPAVVFAVVWFGIQVLQGAWETLSPSMGGGIAWWAHIGGFVSGLVLLPIFLLFAPTQPTKPEWRRGPWDYPN